MFAKMAGWSSGCVSAVTREGRIIWVVDEHRDGKRFLVHADEKLTAFLELQSAVEAAPALWRPLASERTSRS